MKKKKTEFSKKIFYLIMSVFVLIIIYSMALMWKTNTTDGLAYLIPSITTLASTCTGFYYWKAKAENTIKIQKESGISMSNIADTPDNIV